ncbi:MAG: hypothetical protein A3H28_13410 [Acidobacteria bacterium RIFCSPLOWO2_02_FULL_61_28]|nr:MAG: hypothetical protein A3H28_13410 [Acidobacteria bacterium RIFCSPLOWO2_02_FULL_61_28]
MSCKAVLAGTMALLLVIGTVAVMAQLPTATILGVVKDGTGAVVPNASLTARNTETGQTRVTVAAADGSYRFSALPVGTYEVRVEQPGFQAAVRSGLTLTVSQEAVVHFSLEVGAIEQTVSVTAEAPLVNTTSGSLGGLVDEQRVADLPLNGRNFLSLTLLQPGVQEHTNRAQPGALAGTWFSSNGAPLRSNFYMLDGASMVNLYGGNSSSISGTTLGVEGIREFRVATNSFSAEYGMAMGSQMLIVSKNGTNAFHGSLFEYLRNSALDARNFFDYKVPRVNERRLPAFAKNNFGGSVGGPIREDRTFFHTVFEGVRERLGVTQLTNVMGASCHGAAGATITNVACPQLGPTTPSATIAPQIAPLLALFPNPNLPNNQYTYPFSQPTTENYGQLRVDQTFSDNDTLFGRYTVDDTEQRRARPYPQFRDIHRSRAQYATLSETHVFSPTLLNTFRFSYSRTHLNSSSSSGIGGPQFTFVPGEEIGQINVGGVTGFGPDGPSPLSYKQNIFTWSDDLFYTRGRHSLKFGTLINRYQQYTFSGLASEGSLNFASLTTFLRAQPTNYSATTPGSIPDRTYHYTTLGFYLQDDLRLTTQLTLNLGLRYEFHRTFQEVRGHGAALRDIQHDATPTLGPPFKNPSLRNFSPRFGFAWDVRGDGRTAIRGGFGLLYDVANYASALLQGVTASPPFSGESTVVAPPTFALPLVFPTAGAGRSIRPIDYLVQQPHILQYNLTVERQLPFQMAVTLAYGGSRGINLMQNKEGNPTIPLGLPVNGVCTAPSTPPPFRPEGPKCWLPGAPRTNPNWADMFLKTAAGNSFYNSFQFGLNKRLSKSLQFQSSYTWSKAIDDTQGQLPADDNGASNNASDSTNRKADRGLAGFDAAHNWRFNTIYRLPEFASLPGPLGKVVNGWWVSGILALRSGYAFTPVLNSNRSRSLVRGGAAGIDRPDLAPGSQFEEITQGQSRGCASVAAGTPLATPARWFDPCAFTVPAAGFLGTAGRNILRGPGLANLDFSVAKDTALPFLGEGGKLEFRAEFFNFFNRVNFAAPNRTVFAGTALPGVIEAPLATAGRITGTATTSRQVQLALKILF